MFLKKFGLREKCRTKNAFCITFEQHPIKSGHKPLKRSAHDSCSWTDRLFALLVSAQQHGQQFLSGPGLPRGGRSQLSFFSPAAAALKTRFRPRLLPRFFACSKMSLTCCQSTTLLLGCTEELWFIFNIPRGSQVPRPISDVYLFYLETYLLKRGNNIAKVSQAP